MYPDLVSTDFDADVERLLGLGATRPTAIRKGFCPVDHVRRSRGQRVRPDRGLTEQPAIPSGARPGCSSCPNATRCCIAEQIATPAAPFPWPAHALRRSRVDRARLHIPAPGLPRAAPSGTFDTDPGAPRPGPRRRPIPAAAAHRPVTTSVRTKVYVGEKKLTGPTTALWGSDAAVIAGAAQVAAAGVHLLVVEPLTDTPAGFLDQFAQLAAPAFR